MAYRSLSSPVSSKIQAYANEALPAFLDSISYVPRSKKTIEVIMGFGFNCMPLFGTPLLESFSHSVAV